MTIEAYQNATPTKKWIYAASRHPITLLSGYLTVFLWNMSLRPFLVNPRMHWDGGAAVLLHVLLLIGLGSLGLDVMILGIVLPLMTGSCLGAYLFYAQHNFPAAQLRIGSQWSHVDAALHASSYMQMSPVMHWFTGNIGYHHVHHLNARIPFYRLPEAMAHLKELQSPGTTSFHPMDVAACLRLKLWNPEMNRLVGFRESIDTLPSSPSPPAVATAATGHHFDLHSHSNSIEDAKAVVGDPD